MLDVNIMRNNNYLRTDNNVLPRNESSGGCHGRTQQLASYTFSTRFFFKHLEFNGSSFEAKLRVPKSMKSCRPHFSVN